MEGFGEEHTRCQLGLCHTNTLVLTANPPYPPLHKGGMTQKPVPDTAQPTVKILGIFPLFLNQPSLFDFHGFSQFGESARFAAGDEHLAGDDLVQDEILPAGIQLAEDVVQ